MIQGRSALTPRCRDLLRMIDEAGVVSRRDAIRGRRHLLGHVRLLEERGFIACVGDEIHSLSAASA